MEYYIEETTTEALTRMPIETPSLVSYYEETRPLMERLAKKYGRTLTYDRKRTVYIRVGGENTAKTVCTGAHLDITGLMVRHINDSGTLALCNLEGINYNNIEGCSVQVHTRDGNTVTGLLARTPYSTHAPDDTRSVVREEFNMIVTLDELVHSSDEVRALEIEYGDIIPIDPDYRFIKSGFIKSRFIDGKAAVAVVFAMLGDLQRTGGKPQYTTLFALPLYKETGHGGAYLPQEVSEYAALDIGLIGLDYCGSETKVSIRTRDNYAPCDRALTTKLIHLARDQKLDYSVDVFYHYGTDASATICTGSNVYAIAFGMGCFASHGMERCYT